MSQEHGNESDCPDEAVQKTEIGQDDIGAINRDPDGEGCHVKAPTAQEIRTVPVNTVTSGALSDPQADNTALEQQETKVRTESLANPDADSITEVGRAITAEDVLDEKTAAHYTDPPVLSFTRTKRNRYVHVPTQKLRNNLLPSVGFLEFANATDFAANVWNTIPVPIYAAVLMGLGGSIGIILSLFAVKDAILCWRNIKVLRAERAELLGDEEKGMVEEREMDVRLEVNRREMGQEVIDRFSMDVFLGFSAFIVGIGTLMAIAGANPRVYRASNLLSGYIGNSPSGLWGIANSLWCAYLFRRASRHFVVGTRDLRSEAVKTRLKKRTGIVQLHAALMGISTLVSAPAGMVTVTRWWGYPMLVPCIILAKWGNVVFRRRLGYTRDMVKRADGVADVEGLIREMEWTIWVQDTIREEKKPMLKNVMARVAPKATVTEFMRRCGLLEDLSKRLLNATVLKVEGEVVSIDQAMILECERRMPSFAIVAQATFQQKGLRTVTYKERYLLEILGASLYAAANGAEWRAARPETSHREEELESPAG